MVAPDVVGVERRRLVGEHAALHGNARGEEALDAPAGGVGGRVIAGDDHAADARALLRRISLTATRVCGGPDISLGRKKAVQACRDEAVGRAVRKVGSPMLTAVHSGDRITVLLARR